MSQDLIKTFDNLYEHAKFGHAFLICNTNYDLIKSDLQTIFKKYISVENSQNYDIHIIKEEKEIKKQTILNLIKKLSSKSQLNDNIIYVIDQIETLNKFAANSLLKTLEEPEENIYAFLISGNIDKVIPTIKSRCMLINMNTNNIENCDVEIEEFANEVIVKIENTFLENVQIYDILGKASRETIEKIFKTMLLFYKDALNLRNNIGQKHINNFNSTIKIISKNDITTILNKIKLINLVSEQLNYNVNVKMFLDAFLIKFRRITND